MPSYSGTVEYVNVYSSGDISCVRINGTIIILWSYLSQDDTAENRILHQTWLSMVRDGITHGKTMRITTDTGSALATLVELKA